MRRFSSVIGMLTLLGCAFSLAVKTRAQADDSDRRFDKTFTVDVALDSDTLVVNHVDPTSQPNDQFRGDTLVIDGSVYKAGTVPSGMSDFDPKSMKDRIGKIRCRAAVLVPLTDLTTPAATFVSEMYSLPDDNQIILADGPGANLFATVERAVTGGTRSFSGVIGQLKEVNLGLNRSQACDLRVTFKLKSPEREHDH